MGILNSKCVIPITYFKDNNYFLGLNVLHIKEKVGITITSIRIKYDTQVDTTFQ